MAQRDIQLRIDTTVDAAESAKSLGQLRKSLIEIQQLQSQIGDQSSEEFQKLQAAADATSARMAALRDSVGEIGDRIITLEGSQVERLSGSFGLLREGIMNLDFDKVKIGLGGFGDLASEKFGELKEGLQGTLDGLKGMSGRAGELFNQFKAAPLASLTGGFKAITTAIGATTKSVISNTIALLTNPLFLLGAVIVGLVVGLVALAAKLGLVTAVVEAMTAALQFAVALFQKLTDFLGLTTNAQNKFAADTSAAEAKRRQSMEESLSKLEDVYERTKGMNEEEIAALYGKEAAEKIVANNIYDIRKRNAQQQKESFQKELDAYAAIEAAGGELTEEQIKKRDEAAAGYKKATEDEVNAELDKKQRILQITDDANRQLEAWRTKNIQDADERRKVELQQQKEDQIRRIESQIAEAESLGKFDVAETFRKTIDEVNKFYANEEVKVNDEKNKRIAASNKAATDKAKADAKVAADKALSDLQYEEGRKIKATDEGTIQRRDAEISAINKTIAFYKENRKVYGEQTDRLVLDLEDKIKKVNETYDKTQQEIANKEAIALSQLNVMKAEADQEYIDLEAVKLTKLDEEKIKAIQVARDIELQNTELTENERKLIIQRSENEIFGIKKSRFDTEKAEEQALNQLLNDVNQDRIEREGQLRDIKITAIEEELNQENITFERKVELLNQLKTLKLEQIEQERIAQLAAIEAERQERLKAAVDNAAAIAAINAESDAQRVAADAVYAAQKTQITTDTNNKVKEGEEEVTAKEGEERQKRLQSAMDLGKQTLNAASSLANTIFSLQDTFGKKGTEAEKKRAKQQFEIRKALSIGGAVISTIEGVINALTAKSTIPEPFGSILKGINAVSVGAAGLANIAKIAATKFESPSTQSPDTGGGGGEGGTGGMAAPSAPQIPAFTPAQFFNVGQQQAGGPAAAPPIQVVVTETDITQTQTRVRVIEDRATIG